MTPQKAINNKCKECIYDPDGYGNGSWRQQVEDCTATDCPLFTLRPVTQETKIIRREKAIAGLSTEKLAAYRLRQENARKNLNNTEGK